MPLLNGTILAAVFLTPGVLSMTIALALRARALRRSSLSTRAFGLLLFSMANWFIALASYSALFGDCGETLMEIASSEEDVRSPAIAYLLTFPPAVWNGTWIMVGSIALTGFTVHALQSAALTGMAIHEFSLRCELPTVPPDASGLTRYRMQLAKASLPCRFRLAQCVDGALRAIGLVDAVQPLGAGYWLVLLKAARVLQWPNRFEPPEERVARVYADIVQGNEAARGRIGVLYKGTVKHMVCETDGNIVFVLLQQASRWRGPLTTNPAKLVMGPPQLRNPWRTIEKSEAFALDGKSIRNISFRLVDSKPVPAKEQQWAAVEEFLTKIIAKRDATATADEAHSHQGADEHRTS